MVSFVHEQNSICSQKQLNDIAHEHTIICRQLFAGHVVGSRPMKRKIHLHRMIVLLIVHVLKGGYKMVLLLVWLFNVVEVKDAHVPVPSLSKISNKY